jgi:hypothetical protein
MCDAYLRSLIVMKQPYGKSAWLIASICFFGLACLGAALDEPQRNTASPSKQSSRQEAPPAKAAAPTTQRDSSASPSVAATPPAPVPAPTQQPVPKPAEPRGGIPVDQVFHGDLNKIETAQMPPQQLWQQLQSDASHYPINVRCWSADRCAATIVPNTNGTQWQAGANMSEQSFQEADRKLTALGYRLACHQFYYDASQVQFHQGLWLKN